MMRMHQYYSGSFFSICFKALAPNVLLTGNGIVVFPVRHAKIHNASHNIITRTRHAPVRSPAGRDEGLQIISSKGKNLLQCVSNFGVCAQNNLLHVGSSSMSATEKKDILSLSVYSLKTVKELVCKAQVWKHERTRVTYSCMAASDKAGKFVPRIIRLFPPPFGPSS